MDKDNNEKENTLKYYRDKVLKNIKGYPENLIYDIFIKDRFDITYNEYKFKGYNVNQLKEYCELVISDFKYNCGWGNLRERVDRWLNTLSAYEVTLINLRYNNRFNLYNHLRKHNRNYSIYANTYEDIVLNSDVSAERIRQLIAKALRKLRHPSRLKYFNKSIEELQKEEAQRYENTAKLQAKRDCQYQMINLYDDFYKSFSTYFKDENGIVDEQFEKFFQAKYNQYIDETFTTNSALGLRIEELRLSVRAYNCLKHAGCKCVLDLVEMSAFDFYHIRNLGRKSSLEIVNTIHSLGLKFNDAEIDKISDCNK